MHLFIYTVGHFFVLYIQRPHMKNSILANSGASTAMLQQLQQLMCTGMWLFSATAGFYTACVSEN